MPAWLAVSEQVPAARNVTDVPLTVQTDSVVLVNVTVSPDDAVPLTVRGDWAIGFEPGLANVIAWFALLTVNDLVTEVAALNAGLPG